MEALCPFFCPYSISRVLYLSPRGNRVCCPFPSGLKLSVPGRVWQDFCPSRSGSLLSSSKAFTSKGGCVWSPVLSLGFLISIQWEETGIGSGNRLIFSKGFLNFPACLHLAFSNVWTSLAEFLQPCIVLDISSVLTSYLSLVGPVFSWISGYLLHLQPLLGCQTIPICVVLRVSQGWDLSSWSP